MIELTEGIDTSKCKARLKAKMYKQHPAGIGQYRYEKLKKILPE